VLENWRTADVDEKLRATLGFLEKLTLRPESVGPEDVKPLRAAGVGKEAIIDAIYVCFLFNLIDRVADALDFQIPTARQFSESADFLLRRGYK
jgi:alkylhydroperoxidase family enzyme